MTKILLASMFAIAGAMSLGCDPNRHSDDRTSGYEMAKETANSDTPTAKRRGTMVDRSEGTHSGSSGGDGVGTGAPTDTVPPRVE